MTSHSAAIFSFEGKITVRVTVKPGAAHIALPLRGARILPSSYNIPCSIENGNTIVFTLNRPEKVVVVPNYEQAWGVFVERAKGHVPARSWKDTFQSLSKQETWHGQSLTESLSEGYRNPLIILAHQPEENTPDKNAHSTLLVKPGDIVTQAEMDKYETVWFSPGVHDLSQLGEEPWHHTLVKQGQTIYLEGGLLRDGPFQEKRGTGRWTSLDPGPGRHLRDQAQVGAQFRESQPGHQHRQPVRRYHHGQGMFRDLRRATDRRHRHARRLARKHRRPRLLGQLLDPEQLPNSTAQ